MRPASLATLVFLAAAATWPTATHAQAPAPAPPPAAATTTPVAPTGTVGAQATASSGATELSDTKVVTAAVKPAEVTDATELEIGAGGMFNSGNARAVALTGTGRFRIRRKIHEFQAGLAGNYGRAAAAADQATRDTVRNVQGRVRYDVFFHDRVSFFFMATVRHDPFLGLNARVRLDPGFAFYILQQAKHRLWAEAGYDFQVDARRVLGQKDDCLIGGETVVDGCYILDVPNAPAPAEGMPDTRAHVQDRRLITHSVRLFAGYANQLSDLVSFSTGLEYIQALAPLRTSDTDPPKPGAAVDPRLKLWVNWDAALAVQIRKNLAFATTFTLRYDNAPLPGVRRLDTITAVNLVYRFF
ncbi:MAG: DUF481 domain-containing protein [Myxococcales bacterium]|nr:DUF481 domain-containing protein [Myxococcales bacterium]